MYFSHAFFLSLPKPTAWFIYGFWPFQAFFVVVFVVYFRNVILTDEDVSKFEKLVAAKKDAR